jgi:tRNA nucleotidyltransferase (CCA-adding enzyme)
LAKTVGKGFRELHGMLLPTSKESQAVKKRGKSIDKCLKKHFETTRFFRSGSLGNGTSIRGYSDVDYFVCIPAESLKPHAFATLQKVQEVLSACFPNAKISLREPVIVIRFGDETFGSAEIVPAKLIKRKAEGNPVYEIASGDGDGSWIPSSPDVHNNYVDEVDRKFNGEVKQLVSFLKAWKYYCDVPIKSFYLEMFVTKYASQKKSINYSKDIRNIFSLLWNIQLAALKDPKRICRRISPCSSERQKSRALSKLRRAFDLAEKARTAEKTGKTSNAFYWWNLVFAKKFPSYT